jgi:hypothetical protein
MMPRTLGNASQEKFRHKAHFPGPIGPELPCGRPPLMVIMRKIDAWVSHKTYGRMEVAYEVEALATGQRLGLHTSDWRNLVALAHQYGWKPVEGLGRYLHEGKQVVPAYDARALAEALKKALVDLPPERRKEFRPPSTVSGFAAETMRFGADPDPKDYFSWKRRWIVEEVIRLCGRGAVEFRPM